MDKLRLLEGRDGQKLRLLDIVAADWDRVAIQIGFDHSKIRILERNLAHDVSQACWTIFNEWLCVHDESLLPPTWNSLRDVLLLCDYESVADQMWALLDV